MRDETVLLLAGGALLAGIILHRKLTDAAALQGVDLPDILPGAGAAGAPWDLTWPPSTTTTTAPGAPPPATTAPPPGSPAAAVSASNQAFTNQEAAAHASQEADYAAQVAELKARVASGAVTVDSPYYASTMAYLANLRGGVATAADEMAKLHAAGLAGAPIRGRVPRLAWSRPRG